MAYGSSGDPVEDDAQANIGRVRIGQFTMQVDNDFSTTKVRGGEHYVTAYFFGPKETPDGVDEESGIIISSGREARFAEVPVRLLPTAEVMGSYQDRTRRLLAAYVQQSTVSRNSPGAEP